MEENIKILSEMLPPELEKIKVLIERLLQVKTNNRKTNLDYLERNKTIYCPKDIHHRIKKNGHKNGTQRYWCHDCQKAFSITSDSIAWHSLLSYQQFKKILQCMYDYKSLTETALETGITRTSVFEIQIRIFDVLDQIHDTVKLREVVQVDEKYVRISFKGFTKEKMPRESRHNGKENLISGISKDQACIIVAIDSHDAILIKVVGNGTATNKMISKALDNKIEKDSIMVTDSKSSYINYAKKNKLNLVQIPSGFHKFDSYTINDVNEIMTEISIYLYKKKGVSSRHLQHHMNFIRYRKIIKYTIDYLNINEKMFIDTLMTPIQLKSDKVYSTDLPFDIEEYKDWYSKYR